VNDAAADGTSALTLAAFSGNSDVARALIDAGADVNAARSGYSALHAAVLRGDLATVRALIARRADVNARMTKGSPVRRFGSQWALPTPLVGGTPLLVAAGYLEVDILRALVEAGADPSVSVTGGVTPLTAAAGADLQLEARPSDLVRFHIVDNDTPEVPRPEKDIAAAAALLIAAGAHVNQATDDGNTALHVAAASGLTSVIQLLADKGATINVKNRAGQTPLAFTLPRAPQPGRGAGFAGHKAAEDLLRSLGAQ
jgi:ankyrin repeat protein